MKENNEYILGTNNAELHRLGIQHQVWASEAQKGWKLGGFSAGQTILDLGCGPGFCTKELAFITGEYGAVIGVDKSARYIDFLTKVKNMYNLNINPIQTDFDNLVIEENSLDGAFCRWALAWINNVPEIVQKVADGLKPGGSFVVQEYFNWSTHLVEPHSPMLNKCIAAALKSFKDSDSEIDIGRFLPEIFESAGLEVIGIRPLTKLVSPEDAAWNWPTSFYRIYFHEVAKMGLLEDSDVKTAMEELEELEENPNAMIFCPAMVEVIGVKL